MKITISIAALALVGCAATTSDSLAEPTASVEATGKPAPELKLPSDAGKEIDLRDLKGKVVIVDFWASWCGPCKDELPVLESMYKEHKDNGLEVLAVNIDEEREAADALLQQLSVSFPVLYDPNQVAVAEWAPPKMPTSYIIDREGNVSVVQAGFEPREAEELEATVLEHLE